jgi:hypothetical protein
VIRRILTAYGFLGASTLVKGLLLALLAFGVLWFGVKARPRVEAAREAECRHLYAAASTRSESLRVDAHIPQPLSQDLMGSEIGTPRSSGCLSYR